MLITIEKAGETYPIYKYILSCILHVGAKENQGITLLSELLKCIVNCFVH